MRMAGCHGDGHHVKSGPDLSLIRGLEIMPCRAGQLFLLSAIYGSLGGTETDGVPGLDFHEYQRVAVSGDNINLAGFGPVILQNNRIAHIFKIVDGDGFAFLSYNFV